MKKEKILKRPKPVCHISNSLNESFLECIPKSLDEKIDWAMNVMRATKSKFSPTAVLTLFSGGNDSNVLLHLMRRSCDAVVHCNTGIGIEETRVFVRSVVSGYKLKLIEEYPLQKDSYEELVMKIGFPGPAKHNLPYQRLKERSLRRVRNMFVKHHRRDRVMFLAGIRAEESQRRMSRNRFVDRDGSIVWVSPIYFWTREDMDEYRERHSVPENPVSKLIHMSGECLCGAFSKPDEIKEIEFFFPDVAARIHALEDRARSAGVKNCVWGGPRKNLPSSIKSPGPLCAGCQFLDEKVNGSE